MSPFTLEADFLGTLSKVLTDLQGYAILANELVQNADDSIGDTERPSASWMRFDVRDDAVIVSNDGVFSFCGEEHRSCPWETRCDVHAFLRVASETKRLRDDTTGAFGIGFTSVYQVTDRPELISAGMHIVLQPEAPNPVDRVNRCDGCPSCEGQTGTTFVLPWARAGSELRRKLGQEARHDPDAMTEQLVEVLRDTLPFLRRVNRIELLRAGRPTAMFRCERDDNRVVLHGPGDARIELRRLIGDFRDDADELRGRPDAPIEATRSSVIEVLVSDRLERGRLYAMLPTEQELAARMLVSADFFPHSNRRSIDLDGGLRAAWNRAALRAAGRLLGSRLGELPELIGVKPTWELIASVRETSVEATDESLASMWESIRPAVESDPVTPAADGTLAPLGTRLFVPTPADDEATGLLEALGAAVLAPAVRELARPLPRAEMGMRELSPTTLADLLDGADAEQLSEPELEQLWALMDRLLVRVLDAPGAAEAERRFAATATAPRRGGGLHRWAELRRADAAAEVLGPYLALLDRTRLGERRRLAELSLPVQAKDVVTALEHAERIVDPIPLLHWFHGRSEELRASRELAQRLRALRLFPTLRERERRFEPLDQLALATSRAGAFADEAGIARVLDLSAGDEVGRLADQLGVEQLTLEQYVRTQLPRALTETEGGVPSWIDALLATLARQRDEIVGDADLREALAELAFVPCGSLMLTPDEALLPSSEVRRVLGPDWPTYSGLTAAEPLLRDLGVHDTPSREHIVERVRTLTTEPPDDAAVAVVHEMLRLLADRHAEGTEAGTRRMRQERLRHDYADLLSTAWLPAEGDRSRWYAPGELFRTQRRHIFESAGTFLDAPPRVQDQASHVLEAFGVEVEPSVATVVAHLRHCSENGDAMSSEVYRKLSSAPDDPAIEELAELASLLVRDGSWILPSEAFWEDPGLGPFAMRLDPQQWAGWRPLLDVIGVRSAPDHDDAYRVLGAINEAELAPDARAAVAARCWQLLEIALDDGQIEPKDIRATLGNARCVQAGDGSLLRPAEVFADDRPQLSERLREDLGPTLVTRPSSSWQALQAAGVTPVSDHLLAFVSHCSTSRFRTLEGQLRGRRGQIARLLESALGGVGVRRAFERLDALELRAAVGLAVRWQFQLDPDVRIEVTDAGAVWVSESDALYVDCERGALGRREWIDIVRELAFAIGADPSQLAALRDVLEAESDEQADDYLDRLSIPRLSEPVPAAAAEATGHGADEQLAGTTDAGADGDGAAARSDENDDVAEDDDAASVGPTGGASEGEPPARRSRAGGTSGGGSANDASSGGDGGGSAAGGESSGLWWVGVSGRGGNTADSDRDGGVQHARRLAVDRAGVEAVLAYERSTGRDPHEMDHDNPGYDIESRDQDGQIARYIEVKSLRGAWRLGRSVGLTHVQWEFARANGEQTWLYVVEHAETEPQVTCINGICGHATRYQLDAGWRELSEPSAVCVELDELVQAVRDADLPDPELRYVPGADPDAVLDLAWPEQRIAVVASDADVPEGWLTWRANEVDAATVLAVLADRSE